MRKTTHLLVLLVAFVAAAIGQPVAAAGTDENSQTQAVNDGAAAGGSLALGQSVILDSDLDSQRGGQDLHISEMDLRGVVSENAAVNLTTGGNFIGEGAFGNAAGIPLVVQNSGNNVLIQNAVIVNVKVE
jgi:hypothetical protein